ncbi:MAG TPA: DUF1489 domain-containing protein [Xanthobacteraceae bacterium]|nr:DUF1489 domain-containing protein [Xanthobacteraceae bacterium]
MPLHLIKLAVGCDSLKTLRSRIAQRLQSNEAQGLPPQLLHVTRMVPKRDTELLDGGSLYWVIKGEITARQKLVAVEPFRDEEGIGRCRLVLDAKVVAVSPRPMRAFQGWRYLAATDAPADLGVAEASLEAMPESLRRELRELGLL